MPGAGEKASSVQAAEALAPAIRGRKGAKRKQGGKGKPFPKGNTIGQGTRWTKGYSGNPAGRPPDEQTFRDLAKTLSLDLMVEVNARALGGGLTTGQVEAARAIWAEAWGKPVQRTELTGAGGGPVRVQSDDPAEALARRLLELEAAAKQTRGEEAPAPDASGTDPL